MSRVEKPPSFSSVREKNIRFSDSIYASDEGGLSFPVNLETMAGSRLLLNSFLLDEHPPPRLPCCACAFQPVHPLLPVRRAEERESICKCIPGDVIPREDDSDEGQVPPS